MSFFFAFIKKLANIFMDKSIGFDADMKYLGCWRPYSQHFIFFVTYEWAQKAKVLVTGEPFQSSIM
jgi:hypothetical protein